MESFAPMTGYLTCRNLVSPYFTLAREFWEMLMQRRPGRGQLYTCASQFNPRLLCIFTVLN